MSKCGRNVLKHGYMIQLNVQRVWYCQVESQARACYVTQFTYKS